MNGPGLSGYSRTPKMRAKYFIMPYFTPNFFPFAHLHQFRPFLQSNHFKNYDLAAKTKFFSVGWTLIWIGLGWTIFLRKLHGPGLDGLIVLRTGLVGLI